MKRLEELCLLHGVSGDEKEVRDYLIKEYKKHTDTLVYDRLGSVFAKVKGSSNKNVMISSNMDESGVMIQDINEDGSLQFLVIGLLKKEELNQQAVTLLSRTHEARQGIIVKLNNDYVIDAGFTSKEEAEENDVLIGNFAVLDSEFTKLNDKTVLSKNLSNRAGLEIGLRVLENHKPSTYNLNVGGIVLSVVGQRGAITATTSVDPDVAIVVDVAYVKNAKDDEVYIRSFDRSMLPSVELKHYLYKLAKKAGLNPKSHMTDVHSDGSFIHKSLSGTPTIVLVVPVKYETNMRNVLNVKHLDNVEKLINTFLQDLDEEKINDLQFNKEARYEI